MATPDFSQLLKESINEHPESKESIEKTLELLKNEKNLELLKNKKLKAHTLQRLLDLVAQGGADVQALERLLESRPRRAPITEQTILPLNELKRRLDLIQNTALEEKRKKLDNKRGVIQGTADQRSTTSCPLQPAGQRIGGSCSNTTSVSIFPCSQ